MSISRTRGDTYADQFLIRDRSTGSPANLTGCTFKLTLSTTSVPDDNVPPVYQIVGVVANPESGVVEFAPTATQASQVGSFFFDIQMTDGFGKIRTLMLDSYVYTQDITK